ncbi:MAG: amino acid ABC transporter permease [Natronospirillum sp.]|uniref:amino acid ABC transporter permease n=1 Tax=Natronospirillum sp. TaxID=2812955 RepID=UPI0025F92938|nr:amino acid ABC transporter permease [Natronospirillum sp.]MCH8551156.1 amino acid ABC transporter permease [Natronospirillum sp.]
MAFTPTPARQAPPTEIGVLGWLHKNLFSSIPNAILTLIAAYISIQGLYWIISWAFINADWVGTSRDDCTSDGACWVFVSVRINQFIYGFYPPVARWRPNLTFALLVGFLIWLAVPQIPYKKLGAILSLTAFPVVAYFLLYGGAFGLPVVPTSRWGGLMLTIVIAVIGIVLAMPIGIALALGRRSDMPAVRLVCTIFIEFWRGVPLITILFMASVMLPLFFSEGVSIDRLVRALIGITLFQSAYMAEVVRGGLQALGKGQYEAADALGLSYWQKMNLVVLPQALKIMIPGIVNTTISLWKDTSLVVIIGLLEVLGQVRQALADPNWLGYPAEGYIFAALTFWVFCFSMSRFSQYLERRLDTGHRN